MPPHLSALLSAAYDEHMLMYETWDPAYDHAPADCPPTALPFALHTPITGIPSLAYHGTHLPDNRHIYHGTYLTIIIIIIIIITQLEWCS
jgi:hypothetical protein